jgi:cytochrome c
VQAEDYDIHKNTDRRHIDGTNLSFVSDVQDGSYIGFKNIDLTSINKILFRASAPKAGSRIEVRINAPNGELIGKAEVPQTGEKAEAMQVIPAQITNPGGQHDLYFVFRNTSGTKNNILNLDWAYFDNGKLPVPNQ